MPIAPDKVGRTQVMMLREGKSKEEIIAHFGHRFTWDEIEASAKRYKEIKACHKNGMNFIALGLDIGRKEKPMPKDVLLDRERRRAKHHTNLTAYLQGDPLPGESQLYRRQTSPSIVSDPLDGLIYGRIRG